MHYVKNDYGETIVSESHACGSDKSFWYLITFAWHGALLVAAVVLAWQMRSCPHQVNDSAQVSILLSACSLNLFSLRAVIELPFFHNSSASWQ